MKAALFTLAAVLTVSCETFPNVRGEVFFVDPDSGAKGGLAFDRGEASAFGRFYDNDGNMIGGGRVILIEGTK